MHTIDDMIIYHLQFTYLDGPFKGEQGASSHKRSKFQPAPIVGDVIYFTAPLFGNRGTIRITSVS